MMKTLVLSVSLMAFGCGKSDKAADKSGGGGDAPAIDLAAINALVPADLKAKIVFEKTDIVEEHGRHNVTYTLAAPKGWASRMKGMTNLKGPDDVGFFTSLDVGSNCDGTCEPKDWAKIADKVNFGQFDKDKVLKNEVKPGSRLLVVEHDTQTIVVYAWWKDGEKRYHNCTATLDGPLKTAGDAFTKACQAVAVTGEN